LFELIATDNRIVVKYDFEGLVLLGAYGEDGHELPHDALERLGAPFGCRVVRATPHTRLRDLADACQAMGHDQEGFVVRFASGYRLKLKGVAYRHVHALLSNTTPLGLWRVLESGEDLDALRRQIPEEFWTDFDDIARLLLARLADLEARVDAAHAAVEHLTDKELGLQLGQVDAAVRPWIFTRRKGGPAWARDPKNRRGVMKEIRPTNNVLPGYRPSNGLLGALDEG
jgi:RNA ligase